MSAFVGLFFDDIVFLGTDTLATLPYQEGDGELRPLRFVPKVFHLPQLKCAYACLGYQQIGIQFYNFITQRFVGKDINSIVNVGLDHFKNMIEESEYRQLNGSLYLYGYDDTANKFKGYRAHIGHDEGPLYKWMALRSYTELPGQGIIVAEPSVDDYPDKINNKYPDDSGKMRPEQIIERLIIIQKEEDEIRPPSKQVGIGGDVVLTTLYITQNNHFGISSEVAHEFPDKEIVGEYMMLLLRG